MDKRKTEQIAAETILESGVRVKLPAPLFLRVFGKKEISVVIRQPYLGTLMHLSRLSLKADFDLDGIDQGKLDEAHKLMAEHGPTIARMAAVVILNGKLKIRLFSGLLANYLLWKLKPRRLIEVVILIITLSGVQDFTTSIRLIRSMKMTTPKNLSPQDQGSQQDEQPDCIAPGEQSGQSPKQPAGQ